MKNIFVGFFVISSALMLSFHLVKLLIALLSSPIGLLGLVAAAYFVTKR